MEEKDFTLEEFGGTIFTADEAKVKEALKLFAERIEKARRDEAPWYSTPSESTRSRILQ